MHNYLTPEVEFVGTLKFDHVTRRKWRSNIRFPNKKVDDVSYQIFSDIIYWYRPATFRNKTSGEISSYRRKFKSDLLQRSYQEFMDDLFYTRQQVKDSLQRLEKMGLIKRVFRHFKVGTKHLKNVMFIEIFPETIKYMSEELNVDLYTHIRKLVKIRLPRPSPHKRSSNNMGHIGSFLPNYDEYASNVGLYPHIEDSDTEHIPIPEDTKPQEVPKEQINVGLYPHTNTTIYTTIISSISVEDSIDVRDVCADIEDIDDPRMREVLYDWKRVL